MRDGTNDNLPPDPFERFVHLAAPNYNVLREFMQRSPTSTVPDETYATGLDLYALLKSSSEYLGVSLPNWAPSGDKRKDLATLFPHVAAAMKMAKEKVRIRTIQDEFEERVDSYSSMWNEQPTVASATYKPILQKKINELREAIELSDLPTEHKNRILARLNSLQAEMDRPHPRIQGIWYAVSTTVAICREVGSGLDAILSPAVGLLNAGTSLLAEVNKMSFASFPQLPSASRQDDRLSTADGASAARS